MNNKRFFYGSSYDRGLDNVLFLWPDIIEKHPEAELHICYGWELFDIATTNNHERQEWKKMVQDMMQQQGVIHHGRVGKKELRDIRKMCDFWIYPTYFTEINCITALEAQNDGLIPVTVDLAALDETVQSGIKVSGNIRDMDVLSELKNRLLSLMENPDEIKKQRKAGKKFSRKFYWNKIANKWTNVFNNRKQEQPKVSIITPTIREGFWVTMAKNISNQTYKNIQWVIVDDHKNDRADIANKIGNKYGLEIKYIRNHKTKRFGLSQANNKAWQQADGELLVWLQDFIYIPIYAIDRLVTTYQHHPNSLIAPVDQYYYPKTEPNFENKEDWFDGIDDPLGDFERDSIRSTNSGFRKSDYNFEFEMNFMAIPKSILKKLNGFWEFFDYGLGFDNAEIAYRAMETGHDLYVDDGLVAKCLQINQYNEREDHWSDKDFHLSDPRYMFMKKAMEKGMISFIRDESLDKKFKLTYEYDHNMNKEEYTKWLTKNTEDIADKWIKEYE